MDRKRVLIVGATGMVGGLALRDCLRRPEVAAVTSISRRPTGVEDARLTEVLHDDFADYGAVAHAFEDQDAGLFCLGVYTGAVPDAEFRAITVDYAIAFGRALRAGSPRAALCLLSGQGADPEERSRIAFARYKGMAENGLRALGFPRLHLFRPGYVYPVKPRREPNLGYRLLRPLYPFLKLVYPNVGVASDDLARAMVEAALHGTGAHTAPEVENRDVRALAARLER